MSHGGSAGRPEWWWGDLIKASSGSGLYLQACSPNDSHLQLVRASTPEKRPSSRPQAGLCVGTHGERWINKTTKLCMSDTLVSKTGKTTSKNKKDTVALVVWQKHVTTRQMYDTFDVKVEILLLQFVIHTHHFVHLIILSNART